jgi:hypothetical protein
MPVRPGNFLEKVAPARNVQPENIHPNQANPNARFVQKADIRLEAKSNALHLNMERCASL